MDEVRTKKLEIKVNQDKIDYIKLCLPWRGNVLEKSGFREGFNRERRKRIKRLSTFKSFFNSESKEYKDSEHWWNSFLLEIEVFSIQ